MTESRAVTALANQVASLSPPDRLRIAAGLIEAVNKERLEAPLTKLEIAHTIIERVSTELGAALLYMRARERKGAP